MKVLIYLAIMIGVVMLAVAADAVSGILDRSGAMRRLKEENRALAASRDRARKAAQTAAAETKRLRSKLDAADFLRQAGLDEEVDKLLAENAKLRSELAAAERRLDVREKLNLAKEDARHGRQQYFGDRPGGDSGMCRRADAGGLGKYPGHGDGGDAYAEADGDDSADAGH